MPEIELTWQGISLTVSHTSLRFGGPYDHIEVRCGQPLPVTETGYRSYFIHPSELTLFDGVEDYITQVLNEMSQTEAWKMTDFYSRQGELF